MRTLRTLLLGSLLAAAAGLLACGGGKDNPFVGTWYALDGRSIVFAEDTWTDSDGDAGDYSFSGDFPEYELTFVTPDRTFTRRATFLDKFTMDLCLGFASGAVQDCVRLIKDRPIAPG